MTENQTTPAMDAKSAKFSMGTGLTPNCSKGYCNMLYFNPVAGGDSVSHFIYDLYFYIDNPTASQALEFDINQTFGGNRWVWGSECNFNGSGKWDIWDDVNGWKPTSFDCTPFPANTWIHLVWNVERVGNQVHYITLTVVIKPTTSIPTTRINPTGRWKKLTWRSRWTEITNNSRITFGWIR